MHFTHWSVVAVHGQGLFFLAEGRLLVILLHESCTNISFFYHHIISLVLCNLSKGNSKVLAGLLR